MITAKDVSEMCKAVEENYEGIVDSLLESKIKDMFIANYPVKEVTLLTEDVPMGEGIFITLMRKRGFDIVAHTSDGMPRFRAYKISIPPRGE